MSHAIAPPSTLPFASPQDCQALDQFLFTLEPASVIDTLKTLMRGWISSDCIQEKEPDERADMVYDYERLLELLETLQKNRP